MLTYKLEQLAMLARIDYLKIGTTPEQGQSSYFDLLVEDCERVQSTGDETQINFWNDFVESVFPEFTY